MMRWIMRLLAVSGLGLGLVAGILDSREGLATTYTYIVWNFPGTESSTAYLNCGWHDICISDYDGDGLDWENGTNADVFWRSLSANDQSLSYVGTIQTENYNSGSCHTTKAHLRSPLGTSLDKIGYLHTEPYNAGSYTTVNSSLLGATTTAKVGDTVNSDCGQYPAHLHQERDSSNWTKNSEYPIRGGENGCTEDRCETHGVWDQYQHQRTWYGSGY